MVQWSSLITTVTPSLLTPLPLPSPSPSPHPLTPLPSPLSLSPHSSPLTRLPFSLSSPSPPTHTHTQAQYLQMVKDGKMGYQDGEVPTSPSVSESSSTDRRTDSGGQAASNGQIVPGAQTDSSKETAPGIHVLYTRYHTFSTPQL